MLQDTGSFGGVVTEPSFICRQPRTSITGGFDDRLSSLDELGVRVSSGRFFEESRLPFVPGAFAVIFVMHFF
jgi:hypothetical protein